VTEQVALLEKGINLTWSTIRLIGLYQVRNNITYDMANKQKGVMSESDTVYLT
jgi:hypothetical protein